MKSITTLLLIGSCLVTGTIFAESEGKKKGCASKQCSKDSSGGGGKHDMAGKFGKMLSSPAAKEKLGLSDDQVTQIKSVIEANKANFETQKANTQDAMEAIKAVMQNPGASDDDIRSSSTHMANVKADGMILAKSMKNEINAILTDEQIQKIEEMKSQRGKHQKGKNSQKG